MSITSGIAMTMRFHDMGNLTYTSLVTTITQQQLATLCKIVNNFRSNNNDSEIVDGHTKTNITT